MLSAGTFVLAWTQGDPAREVALARKHAHVHAQLCDEDFGRALIHPGMVSSRVRSAGERRDLGRDPFAHGGDDVIQVVHVCQDLADQDGRVRAFARISRVVLAGLRTTVSPRPWSASSSAGSGS